MNKPRNRNYRPWLYCAPALLVLAVVSAWPLYKTFRYSFTDATLATLESPRWAGLSNFKWILTDPDWWRAVSVTLTFVSVSLVLETALGLTFAMAMNQRFRGQGWLRVAVMIPWTVPTVVSAKMWSWMLNDAYGIVNKALLDLGVIQQPIAWLADDRWMLASMALVDVWKTTPFMTLILLAGLQSIPISIYEVARTEGVGPFRRFWSITLPLLRPTLAVALIFRLLDGLRVFDLPFVLTSNSRSTGVLSVYARQQLIDFQEVGYGSAASVLIFGMIAILTFFYIRLNSRAFR
jgi:trehalose/maltose transport system permease protein